MLRRLAWLGLFGVVLGPAVAAAVAGDIAVLGFNEDVITETGGGSGHRFDNYLTNPADWAENGLSSGGSVAVGLPSSGTFLSASGSGVTWHLRPYNANNVLRMGDGDPVSGTMIISPGRYQAVHILAASGMGGGGLPTTLGQTSDITLNFADGPVVLPKALLGYDWYLPYSDATASAVAITGLNRNFIGAGQTSSSQVSISPAAQFTMYETDLNLKSLGLATRLLESITFHDVNDTYSVAGVFGVDGKPIPTGDLNGDGVVNFQDLLILAQHFGQSNATYTQGDITGDGSVNFSDLLILAQNYGSGSSAASLTSVPEPGAAFVWLLAAALLKRRRRRRI